MQHLSSKNRSMQQNGLMLFTELHIHSPTSNYIHVSVCAGPGPVQGNHLILQERSYWAVSLHIWADPSVTACWLCVLACAMILNFSLTPNPTPKKHPFSYPTPAQSSEQNLSLLTERLCIRLHTSNDILGTPHRPPCGPLQPLQHRLYPINDLLTRYLKARFANEKIERFIGLVSCRDLFLWTLAFRDYLMRPGCRKHLGVGQKKTSWNDSFK